VAIRRQIKRRYNAALVKKVLANPEPSTHGPSEFERELIKARTAEGRKRAQARGVKFGRKLKLTPHQRQEALARREAGEALAEIGRSYNVSHSTISRLAPVGA
jgi:hypothetical protein